MELTDTLNINNYSLTSYGNLGQVTTNDTIALAQENYYNFSNSKISSYGSYQDIKSKITFSDDVSIKLVGNTWKALNLVHNITLNTVIEFDFKSSAVGQVHGLGFDNDLGISNNRFFQLYGTNSKGIKNYKNYSGNEWVHYRIPIGEFYTGAMNYLTLINEHDVNNPTAVSEFANLQIYEGTLGNDIPKAVDDQGWTLVNAPVTFKISELFANDIDLDGDSLSLTSVLSKQGGTVTLDNNGNVIFTPTNNFSGQASFEYTISDGAGGTDTATVSINVKSANIGTNLNGISYYSTEVPFLDLFKSSSNWLTQNKTTWNTNENNLLATDENGWVKSLKGTGTSQQFTSVSTLLNRDLEGHYRGGRYLVLYEGQGTLQYKYDAKKISSLSTPGRDVIDITPTNKGILLQLTSTDPNNTGNYLRDIRIVPQEYESNYATNIFNPDFLEKIEPFSTVRFMEWMKTNNSTEKEWSNRPTLDSANWSSKGAPVEVMVELANTLDIDPWFNMPHQATDEYVTQFAKYVKDHLEPERKVYVEYSNEVWNPQFSQYKWVENKSSSLGVFQQFSKRTTQITQMWDQVWGSQKERVIGVMGAQAANPWVGNKVLDYSEWTNTPLSHQEYGIDAIAVAPYMAGHLLKKDTSKQVVKSWASDPNGLDKLFDELNNGGTISKQDAVSYAMGKVDDYAAIAQKNNLKLLAYEGGQHMIAGTDSDLQQLFFAANRDPRMGELYEKYLTQWHQLGGDLFMNFSDIGRQSQWGSWGALEYVDQASSPKYDALKNFINEHSIQAAS